MKKATVTITLDLDNKGQYGYKVLSVTCPEGMVLGGKIGWALSQPEASIALKPEGGAKRAEQTTMPAGMDAAMMEKFMAFMAAQNPTQKSVVVKAAPAKRAAKKAA